MNRSSSARARLRALLTLTRPWHWGKNLLVFFPIFFSGHLLNTRELLLALTGFFSFCFAASGIYALNDCFDAPFDRLHPRKKLRPVASGLVSQGQAKGLAALLFLAALALPLALGALGRADGWLPALLCVGVYVAANVAYSALDAKQLPVVDVSIVALGFVLRILCGSALTGDVVSRWLLLTVLTASYYMALGKRRGELRAVSDDGSVRPVLTRYTDAFLTQSMAMFLTMTLVFYSLWSVDAQTVARYGHEYVIVSVPLVIVIVLFYNLDIETGPEGDPMEVILGDKRLLALAALYAALMFSLLYLGR